MPKYKAASQTKKDTPAARKKRRALIKEGHDKMMSHGVPVLAAAVFAIIVTIYYATMK